MVNRGIRDKVAIVAMGCTSFGEHWDRSADDLLLDAATETLSGAQLSREEVDAYWVGTLDSGTSGRLLSRALKTGFKPVTRVENLCASGSEAFRNACYAVASGAADVAMAVGVEKLKDSGYSGLTTQLPPHDGTTIASSAPAAFGLLAPAYGRAHGLDDETLKDVLTRIAWKNHHNGAKNPRAQFRQAIDREKIRNAPRVAGMLGVHDCSGVSDGAAAAIIVPAEDAHRFTDQPLFVKALSLVAGSGDGPSDPSYDYTSIPEVVACVDAAYREAGVADPRTELVLAEVHDCFTPTELVLMEDLRFSAPGQAWRDVLDGAFDLDGQLPVNPDGGLKSFGHPIGASGLRMLFECWLQLRGEAPSERQIEAAREGPRRLALTQNLGGRPGDCVSFVGIVGTEVGP